MTFFVFCGELSSGLHEEIDLARTESAVDAALRHAAFEHVCALHGGTHGHAEVEPVLHTKQEVLEKTALAASALANDEANPVFFYRVRIKLFHSHLHTFVTMTL